MAASEWSLWIAALASTGIICGFLARFKNRSSKILLAALIAGALAFIFTLYPFFSSISAAREQGVPLSFEQYFAALWNDSSEENKIEQKTYTFANVDGNALQVDVYSPSGNTDGNGAGVIVIHGGSWNAGQRSDFPQWNRWLARKGFVVFDIDYRLAPQPNWQAATGDVKCAVWWVKQHSEKFKISADRLVLFGRSAGAHLALLAAYSADDTRLPSSCGDNDSRVRAVVSFYAPTDLLWAFDNPANRFVLNGPETLRLFLGGNPYESDMIRERFSLASPTSQVNSHAPPTLLVHGGHDQLVRPENMYLLGGKLKEAGVSHKTIFIPYAQHGFDYNFNGWGAQTVKPVLLEFLRENTKL